jgi:hypothetical protein
VIPWWTLLIVVPATGSATALAMGVVRSRRPRLRTFTAADPRCPAILRLLGRELQCGMEAAHDGSSHGTNLGENVTVRWLPQ